MSSVRRWGYAFVAVVGLWQCLAPPPATASSIPFYVTNQGAIAYKIECFGPWGRRSDPFGGFVSAGQERGNFYSADVTAFSPFGSWHCEYFGPTFGQGALRFVNEVDFCLAPQADEVLLVIPPHEGQLQVFTPPCPPQGALPPPALIELAGAATGVGESEEGQAAVKLKGKFNVSTPLALNTATVTLEALLHEVEGAEELVSGLPLVLTPRAGSDADEATFKSVPHRQPKVRLDIRERAGQPAEFRLKLEQATIPQFPQHCALEEDPTTALALRFTIDDGVNLPLVVEGEVAWECKRDPQEPETLTVEGLLPLEPRPAP
jgi:hypothetical protein